MGYRPRTPEERLRLEALNRAARVPDDPYAHEAWHRYIRGLSPGPDETLRSGGRLWNEAGRLDLRKGLRNDHDIYFTPDGDIIFRPGQSGLRCNEGGRHLTSITVGHPARFFFLRSYYVRCHFCDLKDGPYLSKAVALEVGRLAEWTKDPDGVE